MRTSDRIAVCFSMMAMAMNMVAMTIMVQISKPGSLTWWLGMGIVMAAAYILGLSTFGMYHATRNQREGEK